MKKLALISMGVFTVFALQAQKFTPVQKSSSQFVVHHEFKMKPQAEVLISGQSYVDFANMFSVVSMDQGLPALPLFHATIQLPNTGNPTIQVTYDSFEEIQNVHVAPSKGALKRNVSPASVPYTFSEVYQQNEFYPQQIASLKEPFAWRSMRGAVVEISPIQYNPVTATLRIYRNLKVMVQYNENQLGVNEISESKDPVLRNLQNQWVINPDQEKYVPIEEEGSLLIIAGPAYTDEMMPLVHWKNQKGIRTEMVTTDITGTVDTDILNFIQSYYSTHPELVYVLLVGDHETIPAHTYGMSGGENLYSDSYYGQLIGTDYMPEVFVGRFSGTEAHVVTMVNRTLEYEKTPAAGTWMENAVGLGSNEGNGIGNDGEPDWQHLRNIRTILMNYGYTTVSEFYDGSHGGEDASGNPSASIILPVVNSGVGLFNYTGHGDVNLCVTGNFQSSHINQATNNGMYPFVISVACNNGTFMNTTCISESWMRATSNNSPTGAIASAGSSILMAWAAPMQTQDEMAQIIAETNPLNIKTTVGGLFYNSQLSMLEDYPTGSGIEVMQTWVFFGDPSTQFRNKETMALNMISPSNVPQSATTISVNCDVDGALVAISQNNVLLGYAYASGGVAQVSIPSLTTNDYLIATATKQNYATKQALIQVGNGPLGIDENSIDWTAYPNPTQGVLTVRSTEDLSEMYYRIRTLDGKEMISGKLPSTGIIYVETLTAGTYFLQLESKGVLSTLRFVKQ
jgi:gingipain R